jgi:hypothetical protein
MLPRGQPLLEWQPVMHIPDEEQICPGLQRASVAQPATQIFADTLHLCSSGHCVSLSQPARQVSVVASQTPPLQSASIRQPALHRRFMQMLPVPQSVSFRQPGVQALLWQIAPAPQSVSCRQPGVQALFWQISPAPQALSMSQPGWHWRAVVSQYRPVVHSVSSVQPILHVLVARSQYDSIGQGQFLGGVAQLPMEQICPVAQALPHPPQWVGSVAGSTHVPPQWTSPAMQGLGGAPPAPVEALEVPAPAPVVVA